MTINPHNGQNDRPDPPMTPPGPDPQYANDGSWIEPTGPSGQYYEPVPPERLQSFTEPPKKKRTTLAWLAGAAVACLMFLVIGVAIGSADADPAASKPVPTVTTTTTKTDTKTVTKEVVPQACLTALDLADEGFGYASDALTAAQKGFEAVNEFDMDKLASASEDMKSAGDKTGRISGQYNDAKAECRAS